MAKKEAAAYRLAKLSLTLRGISHNLGETNDSRFAHALPTLCTRDCISTT